MAISDRALSDAIIRIIRANGGKPVETVSVPAYQLTPGNVIVWENGSRQTVSRIHSEPVARGRRVYVVGFVEGEPHRAAPARFSQDDVFQVERVN